MAYTRPPTPTLPPTLVTDSLFGTAQLNAYSLPWGTSKCFLSFHHLHSFSLRVSAGDRAILPWRRLQLQSHPGSQRRAKSHPLAGLQSGRLEPEAKVTEDQPLTCWGMRVADPESLPATTQLRARVKSLPVPPPSSLELLFSRPRAKPCPQPTLHWALPYSLIAWLGGAGILPSPPKPRSITFLPSTPAFAHHSPTVPPGP